VLSGNYHASKDTCLKINETRWKKISQKKNYVETYKDSETKEEDKSKFKMPSTDFGGFKYVFYFIVAGAILFVVVKILQNINSSPVIDIDKGRVYTLSEVEDKMLEIDLDKILNDALIAKDYRLALRINFLIIIKTLSLSGKITWTKEKTNWEYFSELKDEKTALKFKEIVMTFESIWYGEHALTENQFNRLEPSYETFKNKLA
jgi:hypothetical protein